MTLQDLQAQLQQQIASLQNAEVANRGTQKAVDYTNAVTQTRNNFNNFLQQINQLGLQNDPQALQMLSKFVQNPTGDASGGLFGNQLSTYLTQQQQAQYQQQQLAQLTQQQQAAAQDARTQMLAQIPQEMGTLNQNLVNTEQQAMTQLQPQIDQRLNALGLLQSGALPQAYAQAQTGLDIARENQLNQFQLGAMQQIGTGIPLNALQSQLANMQQSTQGNIDLSQQGAARNYALGDVAAQQQFQQQQQANALYAARQNQPQSNNILGEIMGGIGAAGSIAGTAFTGNPMFLSGLPSSIGMIAGGGEGANMGSTLTSPMIQALSQMRNQRTPTPSPNFYGTGYSPLIA